MRRFEQQYQKKQYQKKRYQKPLITDQGPIVGMTAGHEGEYWDGHPCTIYDKMGAEILPD